MSNFNEEDQDGWKPPSAAEMKVLEAKQERSNKISKLLGDYLLKGYKMLGATCPVPECATILLRDKQGNNYCVACSELDSDTSKDDPALSSEAARRVEEEGQQRGGSQFDDPSDSDLPSTSHQTNTLSNGFRGMSIPDDLTLNHFRSDSTERPNGTDAVFGQYSGATAWNIISGNHARNGGSSPTTGSRTRPLRTTIKQEVDGSNPCRSPLIARLSPAAPDMSFTMGIVQRKMEWAAGELENCNTVEGSIQLCNLIKVSAETIASLKEIHAPSLS